jgi:tRNA pseudouridine38-40 synthase
VVARVRADAFCHNMVRALIGSALRVGEGFEDVGWLHERMLARVRDAKTRLAPPHPLVLEEVGYPESGAELAERAELTRALREPLG